ncbi:MAG: DNA polymerase III subunit delta, partial [Clostridia bacterium]|nr:DNA polymerase III subunit delta [Clostridia bacterium]
MREIFKQLFGNERLKAALGESIANGTASHAYIIDGPKGTGKHTVATLAAAALSCENRSDVRFPLPCGVCPVCVRILKGISADVITVSKEDKASIGVGRIRSIREDLYVTPNDSDKKIYIIEDADLMTPQAQNALLIFLE